MLIFSVFRIVKNWGLYDGDIADAVMSPKKKPSGMSMYTHLASFQAAHY